MKILKKIVFYGLFLVIAAVAFSQYKILLFNDISIEPISKKDNVDFQAGSYQERPPVYLVSYADGPEVFYKNQNTLVLSALNKGIDFFLNYRRSLIDREFYEKHKSILQDKPGAGWWLWKPYVILKTLENAPENAIVIYMDSGYTFKAAPAPLIAMMKSCDILLIQYDPKIHGWVGKNDPEILKRVNCTDDKCLKAYNIWGAFGIYKNTPTARAFVKKWLESCYDEVAIRTLRDEVILSVVYHQTPEEVKTISVEEAFKYIMWHHRHPGNEYKTILPNMYKNYRGWERAFANHPWIIPIRKYFLEKYSPSRQNMDK